MTFLLEGVGGDGEKPLRESVEQESWGEELAL